MFSISLAFSVSAWSQTQKSADSSSAVFRWEKRLLSGDLQGSREGFAPLLRAALDQGVFNADARLTADEVNRLKGQGLNAAANASDDPGLDRFQRTLKQVPDLWQWSDDKGENIAHWLAEKNDLRLMGALLQAHDYGALFSADHLGRLPTHYMHSQQMAALVLRQVPLSRYMLAFVKGVSLWSQQDHDGATPLHRMVETGDVRSARYVTHVLCRQSSTWFQYYTIGAGRWALDQWIGNELNIPDHDGRTALHQAAIKNSLNAAEALASCPSTKLGILDKWGRTALHYAAAHRDFSAGYAILTHGTRGLDDLVPVAAVADINIDAQDEKGNTALHEAYRCGNHAAVEMLRRFGARDLRNSAGLMPDEVKADPSSCPDKPGEDTPAARPAEAGV